MSTISIEPPAPQQPIALNIQDLQNLLLVVDVAAQRGAFKANELSQIGGVFDRISKFVQSAAPQQESAPQAASAPQTPPQVPQPASSIAITPPAPLMPVTAPPFAPKTGTNS